MSAVESKTPYFGLVDFFLYLAPGTIVLLSLMLVAGVTAADLSKYSSLATSILAILVAYFLGHAVYPLSYILRNKKLHGKLCRKQRNSNCDPYKESFSQEFQEAIFSHPDFCLSQLVRYKSLARFTIAMVWPSIFMAFGIAFYIIKFVNQAWIAIFSFLLLICTAYGFFCRFGRYWRRADQIEEHCKSCPIHEEHFAAESTK